MLLVFTTYNHNMSKAIEIHDCSKKAILEKIQQLQPESNEIFDHFHHNVVTSELKCDVLYDAAYLSGDINNLKEGDIRWIGYFTIINENIWIDMLL